LCPFLCPLQSDFLTTPTQRGRPRHKAVLGRAAAIRERPELTKFRTLFVLLPQETETCRGFLGGRVPSESTPYE